MFKRLLSVFLLLPVWTVAQDVPKAISVDPMGIPPGETSTLVVNGTALKDSTSLWTNLAAQVTRIDGNSPATNEQQITSVFTKDAKPPAGTLILEAEDYDRGTWGKRPPFILNIGGSNANTAEWDVGIPVAGNFVLELNYASGGERPVKLSVNGNTLTDTAATTQTGGFGPNDGRWVPECVLALRKGKNTIRMERTGGTPHFDKLALVPTTKPAATRVAAQPTDRVAPYMINVPPQAAVGINGLRIATSAGISNLLLFMVDDLPTVKEIRGSTASLSGQEVSLPAAVEGYCDSTHVDCYSIEVSAGKTLSFEVVAQRLGTRLDPLMKLLDAEGQELAFADDSPGLSGDCWIRYRFTKSGRYFVTIEDSLAGGSSSYRYRLRMGDFPLITTPIPASIQSGVSTELSFSGLAADELKSEVSRNSGDALSVSSAFPDGMGSGFAQIGLSPYPQFVVDTKSPAEVPVPGGISGVFSRPGDSHRCLINVTKGQKLLLTDRSRSRGVPALVAISILDESGQQVASVRKAGPAGQSLKWSAPKDGQYQVVFTELTGRGGGEFGYHVEIEEARADFQLSVEKDNVILPQNGYAILKVTADRQGYNGPIQLSVTGAGDSPKLGNSVIDEKKKETRLKVYMPSGMQVGQTCAIEVVGTATIDEEVVRRMARTITAFRKALPQTTHPPAGLDGFVALSVGPEIPDFFSLSLDGGEILFPRLVGEVYFTVRVKDRDKGFRDMVSISVDGFPEGFSAGGGERAVGGSNNNEYRFQLRGPTQIESTETVVRIVAEATFKGQTKEVELTKVPFRIIDPLIVTATPSAPFRPGSRGQLQISARRFVPRAGGDKAEIAIAFDAVPKGFTIPETAVIPAGSNSVKVPFTLSKEAEFQPVRLTARTVVAGETVVVTTTVKDSP